MYCGGVGEWEGEMDWWPPRDGPTSRADSRSSRYYREKLKKFVIKTTLIILKIVFLHRLHQLAYSVFALFL